MHTDELRAELRELANEEHSFTGDLPAIRRQVVRRRVAGASIAIVAIAAVTVGAVVLTRSRPDRVNVAHSVKQVALAELPRFDASVILPDGATAADARRVEGIIDDSGAVVRWSPLLVRNLAYALSFNGDPAAKALRARVCAAPSTKSFAVELSRTDARAEQHLREALGADITVASARTQGTQDLEVFMQVHAKDSQIDAVRDGLEHDPDVSSFDFVDHQDAYKEFKRLFADQPKLIENETPAGLPTSFRITLRDGTRPADVAKQLQDLPGVDQVNTAPTGSSLLPDPSLTFADICASKPFSVNP